VSGNQRKVPRIPSRATTCTRLLTTSKTTKVILEPIRDKVASGDEDEKEKSLLMLVFTVNFLQVLFERDCERATNRRETARPRDWLSRILVD